MASKVNTTSIHGTGLPSILKTAAKCKDVNGMTLAHQTIDPHPVCFPSNGSMQSICSNPNST